MFRDNDDVKILISGLKCGGLGLNFPWANRCISLDLWVRISLPYPDFESFRLFERLEVL